MRRSRRPAGRAPWSRTQWPRARWPRASWRRVPLLVALGVGCHLPARVEDAVVGPDVLETLRRGREARVVIALAPPPDADEAGRRAAIARTQVDVLARLDARDVHEVRRWASVPAMACVLRSERGLAALRAHPAVRRIDLDVGGGGAPHGTP